MSKWMSRKLFAAIGGVVVVILVQLGMDEAAAQEVTDAVVKIIAAFVIGQGISNVGGALATRNGTKPKA